MVDNRVEIDRSPRIFRRTTFKTNRTVGIGRRISELGLVIKEALKFIFISDSMQMLFLIQTL